MCGIAGALGGTKNDSIQSVKRMLNAMEHRGPDQDGLWFCASHNTVLGHRRLSIIDLSEAGRQPMVDESTGVSMTFNGECYNYQELRADLVRAGHDFRSTSDTEVVLKAYIEWGGSFVSRMRGMFALAIWDPKIQETLLVRDRMGIKPLYYSQLHDKLLFASEVRALLNTNEIKRNLDSRAVASYLWQGFVPGPDTIVEDIKRLNPGSLLRVDAEGRIIEERAYWQLPSRSPSGISANDAIEACRAELNRATAEHMVSDVPLGVFLSGGVDSSVIAAMAQRASSIPVTTYNIRFEETQYDESRYARQVARTLGTNHQELTLTESKFRDQLEHAIGALDQPTFDAVNTYFVSRAVKEAGITVALAGTGGDELFGGYSSFEELPKARSLARALGFLPGTSRSLLARAAGMVVANPSGEVRPQIRWGKLGDLLETKGDLLGLYQVSYALFSKDLQHNLLCLPQPQRSCGLAPEHAARLRAELKHDGSILESISRLEMANFLGERLLPDTDAASMAVSMEVRVPLLDHQFVESLQFLTPEQRYEPLGRKTFLKSAIANEVDPAVFDRPKAGFELPLEKWCRNLLAPELDATFRDINLAHSVGLDAECVSRLWRAFTDGAPGLYWSRIWSLFVLMTWCKRYNVRIA